MTPSVRRLASGLALVLATCHATGDPASRPIAFPAPDGASVVADEYGSGPRGVVLVHGGRFDRSSWVDEARTLARAGFRVVAIDLRDEGDAYDLDVLGAVRWLRAGGAESVAVVGGSLGGWAAARAAARAEAGEIERLVLLAHSPIEHPERLRARTLFLVAREDPYADGTPRLADVRAQYERAPGPKELVVVDGRAHAQFLFDSDQGERVMAAILRFLSAP